MKQSVEEFGTEVFDEAELAEIAERRERDSGVLSIRAKVFQGTAAEAAALVDPDKECKECGEAIPVARQYAKPDAIYCIDCQQWHDKMEERKRKLVGSGVVNLFG